jgi:hypothetical protein
VKKAFTLGVDIERDKEYEDPLFSGESRVTTS